MIYNIAAVPHSVMYFLSFFFILQTILLIQCSFSLVSNADRVSWWELTLLASHVHPSVSTMARTLLSGNNIVYSGDPLTDLSLPAFLDKFMEKKPKGNRIAEGKWHGGSQIAPARKVYLYYMFFFC
jgi:ribosome biogenesis protein MAK21